MVLKIVQVNIYAGKYLEDLVDFLKGENPDFVTTQEVTTNGFNLSGNLKSDLFEVFQANLNMHGVFNGDLKLKGDESSVFGNAVFSKYKIVSKNVVTLKEYRPVSLEELEGIKGNVRELISRHLLDATVVINESRFHIMSIHGAWTAPPQDTVETLRQAKVVADYLKTIKGPFILGGDFNNIPESRTIGIINEVAVNLMINSGVGQTTHPKIHKIVPRGYSVDYIFVSEHFKLKKIEVPDVTVSDHLPVVAELELLL